MKKTKFLGFGLLFLLGCSSVSYRPEVSGKGVILNRGSLVYSLPAEKPLVKMRMSFRGINDGLLRVHLRFIRKTAYDPANPISLDSKEQTLDIGDAQNLVPNKIYASIVKKPLIELSQDPRQAVDILYKVPLEDGKVPEFPFFKVHINIRLASDKVEERVVRYDRQSKTTTGSEAFFYDDPDFGPYGESDMGWYPGGWAWW